MTTWMEDDYLNILIENNTMVVYPPWSLESRFYDCLACAKTMESNIIIDFLGLNPYIVPTYIDAHYEFGRLDPEYGNWSGMIGHVRNIFLYSFNLKITGFSS